MTRLLICFLCSLTFIQFVIAEQIFLKKIIKKDSQPQIATIPLSRFCKSPVFENPKEPRVDLGAYKVESGSKFLSSDILNFSIISEKNSCGAKCRNALSHAILVSLGIWRSGCSRCDPDSLRFVNINNTRWIDNITLDKWKSIIDRGEIDITSDVADPFLFGRRSFRFFGSQPVVDYINIDNNSTIERICKNSNKFKIDNNVLAFVCNKPYRQTECNEGSCANIFIYLSKLQSKCKLNSSTIACGIPDSSIGFNIENYKFSYKYGNNNDVVIGNESGNKISLLYTTLHEMGHFFGLPHDNSVSEKWPINIMKDGYSDSGFWCVSEWNLNQLDSAMDINWSKRLQTYDGLKYIKD